MRALRLAAPAAVALVLLGVAPAQADQQIVAAPVDRFVVSDITIAPGETLTFASRDALAPHNVTARDNGADGRPLFSSATIGGGDIAPVTGADKLAAGSYAFFCTVHPAQMNGTLTVGGEPVAPDTTAPVLGARIDSRGLRTLEQTKTLLTTLTASEAVTATVKVRAFDVTLASRSVSLAPGATAVVLKLTAAGLPGLRKRSRVNLKITVSGQDGAGNAGTGSAKRTLRRR